MLPFFVATLLFAAEPNRPVVVLVVGAEGTPEFGRQFEQWAGRWQQAAEKANARLIQIGRGDGGKSGISDPKSRISDLKSEISNSKSVSAAGNDRDRLKDVLIEETKDASTPLWLVLIGHGTFDGKQAKFNLRGPDVSDRELAEWLKPIERPLAVIDCTSASGPFLKQLAASGRVVVTATRSGFEHNFSRFGDYFSAAISDASADLDKDGQTSLLEAYLAAVHRTEEFYKQESRLATEHALLDDNGDGLGTPADFFQGVRAARRAKDGAALDGARAHQWCLVLSTREQNMPAEVRQKRDQLELQIDGLRDKKSTLPEAEYYTQLEALLLDLARLYANHVEEQTPTKPAAQSAAK